MSIYLSDKPVMRLLGSNAHKVADPASIRPENESSGVDLSSYVAGDDEPLVAMSEFKELSANARAWAKQNANTDSFPLVSTKDHLAAYCFTSDGESSSITVEEMRQRRLEIESRKK